MFSCFDLVIDEPCTLFLSTDFGKVCASWHVLGGGNKAMVHAEGRIQSSLVVLEGGESITRFVDKPDCCCFSTKLVCVWQVWVLEIILLETVTRFP